MPNKTQMAFARQVYAAAVEANTEIDPAFVTAQAMLETGWGSKVIGNANLFGITKGSQWDGPIVMEFCTLAQSLTPWSLGISMNLI